MEDLFGVHVVQPQQDLCEGCEQSSRGYDGNEGCAGRESLQVCCSLATQNLDTHVQVTKAVADQPPCTSSLVSSGG